MADGSGAARAVDALVIGGGPAGLSAALNLGRARESVSAGGCRSPAQRGDAALARLPHPRRDLAARAAQARTRRTRGVPRGARPRAAVCVAGRDSCRGCRRRHALHRRGAGPRPRSPAGRRARSVLVATGLRETLPAIPSLRAFYGMTLFSCAACDAWELQDRPLALIGETRRPRGPRPAHRPLDRPPHGLHERRRRRRHGRGGRARGIRDHRRTPAASTTSRAIGAPCRRSASSTATRRDRRRVRPAAVAPGARLPRGPRRRRATRTATSSSTARGAHHRRALRGGGCGRARSPAAHRRRRPGRRAAAVLVHDLLGVRTAH